VQGDRDDLLLWLLLLLLALNFTLLRRLLLNISVHLLLLGNQLALGHDLRLVLVKSFLLRRCDFLLDAASTRLLH
jgi:hypothetical protein